jgi:predicted DCC family thiol-disulfide oxidoreductase YuxK
MMPSDQFGASSPSPSLTIWYDGDCPICSQEIDWLKRQTDASIAYVDQTTATVLPLERSTLMRRFHALELNGPLLSGIDAFAALGHRRKFLKPLSAATGIPVFRCILELSYECFLQFRPRLQRFFCYYPCNC